MVTTIKERPGCRKAIVDFLREYPATKLLDLANGRYFCCSKKTTVSEGIRKQALKMYWGL